MKMIWFALYFGMLALPVNAQGIISLDYCADQYLLALVDGHRISALSVDADSNYSYLAERAKGFSTVRAEAEDVLIKTPELIVRQWGGGVTMPTLLARLDIPMVQVGYSTTFDDVEGNLTRVAAALGAQDHAVTLIQNMRRKLARVDHDMPAPRALYMTPGGVTTGAGTFVHEILQAANVRNMAAEQGGEGWLPLDLERVVLNPPDIIITGFFDLGAEQPSHWSIARHALLRALLENRPSVHVPGHLLACPAWFAADAVVKIHDAAHPTALARHD